MTAVSLSRDELNYILGFFAQSYVQEDARTTPAIKILERKLIRASLRAR